MTTHRWMRLSLLVLALGALACGGNRADGHPGHGVVQAVDVERGEVTIDHDDIPGLMKGMTMTFEVPDRSLLGGIGAGDAVDFSVREEGGRYLVTAIRRSAP